MIDDSRLFDKGRGLDYKDMEEDPVFLPETMISTASYWAGYNHGYADAQGADMSHACLLQDQTPATARFISINRLATRFLKTPIDVIVEQDGDGFIARMPDLPLYGYGEDEYEAIEGVKAEIESVYEELLEDDEFSPDWLDVRNFLKGIVVERP